MSDAAITGIKHTHVLLVFVFVIGFFYKSILLFLGKDESLEKFRSKTKVVLDMVVPTLFIILGIIMLVHMGMKNMGGWFHLKLTLVVISVPLGIVAMRKKSKVLTAITCLIFVYLILLAYAKAPLLWF